MLSENPKFEKTLFSPKQNIAFIDFDDTIFPTGYLQKYEINYDEIFTFQTSLEDLKLIKELNRIEQEVLIFLEKLLEEDFEIFIISNATKSWIENCLTHFMYELKNFFEDHEIKIFSAKNMYSKTTISNKWKFNCFKKVLIENFSQKNLRINLLCIGDSEHEKKASRDLMKINYYDDIQVKFIKMIPFLSGFGLALEWKFLTNNYKTVINSKAFLHKVSISIGDINLKNNDINKKVEIFVFLA